MRRRLERQVADGDLRAGRVPGALGVAGGDPTPIAWACTTFDHEGVYLLAPAATPPTPFCPATLSYEETVHASSFQGGGGSGTRFVSHGVSGYRVDGDSFTTASYPSVGLTLRVYGADRAQ